MGAPNLLEDSPEGSLQLPANRGRAGLSLFRLAAGLAQGPRGRDKRGGRERRGEAMWILFVFR